MASAISCNLANKPGHTSTKTLHTCIKQCMQLPHLNLKLFICLIQFNTSHCNQNMESTSANSAQCSLQVYSPCHCFTLRPPQLIPQAIYTYICNSWQLPLVHVTLPRCHNSLSLLVTSLSSKSLYPAKVSQSTQPILVLSASQTKQ